MSLVSSILNNNFNAKTDYITPGLSSAKEKFVGYKQVLVEATKSLSESVQTVVQTATLNQLENMQLAFQNLRDRFNKLTGLKPIDKGTILTNITYAQALVKGKVGSNQSRYMQSYQVVANAYEKLQDKENSQMREFEINYIIDAINTDLKSGKLDTLTLKESELYINTVVLLKNQANNIEDLYNRANAKAKLTNILVTLMNNIK